LALCVVLGFVAVAAHPSLLQGKKSANVMQFGGFDDEDHDDLDDVHPVFHDAIKRQREADVGMGTKIKPGLKKHMMEYTQRMKERDEERVKDHKVGSKGAHGDLDLSLLKKEHPEIYEKITKKKQEITWETIEEGVECRRAKVEKGDLVTFHFHTLGHNHIKDEYDLDSRKLGEPYTLRVGRGQNYLKFDDGMYGACKNEKRLISVPAHHTNVMMGIMSRVTDHAEMNIHPEESTQYEVEVLKIVKAHTEL